MEYGGLRINNHPHALCVVFRSYFPTVHCAAIGNIIERARLGLAIFRFGGFSDAAREQRENKLCIFLALISVSLPPPSPPPSNFNLPPVVQQLKTFSSSSPTNWIRISSMYTIPVAPLCPFYEGGCFACYRGKIFTEITHTSETRIFTLPDFRWVVFSCFDHFPKNKKSHTFGGHFNHRIRIRHLFICFQIFHRIE